MQLFSTTCVIWYSKLTNVKHSSESVKHNNNSPVPGQTHVRNHFRTIEYPTVTFYIIYIQVTIIYYMYFKRVQGYCRVSRTGVLLVIYHISSSWRRYHIFDGAHGASVGQPLLDVYPVCRCVRIRSDCNLQKPCKSVFVFDLVIQQFEL